MKQLIDESKSLQNDIVRWRRHLHQNPEVGLDLENTKTYVMEELRKMGYEPEEIGKCGVTVVVGKKREGKTFLLRADMDALPMSEETGRPFASKNGCMHACGHDCHTAMLLGAASLLKKHEDEIKGQIKLLFQPGEETLVGAKSMVEAGILENPAVDAAMMIHVISGIEIPSGMFGVFGAGPCYASADWFRIRIQGRGSHGAQPQAGINPLAIMTAIYGSINEIVALNIPSEEQAVMTVGEMHGGTTGNIIPDTAYMTGTIRTFNETLRKSLKEKLVLIAEKEAQMRGGRAEVEFFHEAPCVICDKKVSQNVLESLRGSMGEQMVVDLAVLEGGAFSRSPGSEDFAYIAEKVPSAVVWFMAGSTTDGYCYPGHHPKTDYDESVLYLGAAAYACCGMSFLEKAAAN